jgi:Zn ribbon nucleic-acid-binding protein
MSTLDLDKWFEDDELRECPVCGAQKLLPVSEDAVSVMFCLTCGLVVPSSGDHARA